MALLRDLTGARFIMGNHDHWYADGLPNPRPDWMTDGEMRHQYWTHKQLGSEFQDWVRTWPWIMRMEVGGIKLAFMHYALGANGHSYKILLRNPTPEDLDRSFDDHADIYFYGHVHIASDLQGRARYLTPGSLGCQKKAIAPYFLLEITADKLQIEKKFVPYEDGPLFEAFESRKVPEREFIYQAFFGGRFPPKV
jgi:predicted phosphodiesterase